MHAFAAGAPLEEELYSAPPDPLAGFGEENREERMENERKGKERKWRKGGMKTGVEFASLALSLEGIDAPGRTKSTVREV